MPKRLTTQEFIERATKIYQGKYKYDKVNYVDARTKVIITCPKHGDFQKVPFNHLNGQGCPMCTEERIGATFHMTTEKFILKAKTIHGDKYEYSKVNYINNSTCVTILCLKHGAFEQTPANHLWGQGCPKCANERLGRVSDMDTAKFIQRSKYIHGERYDYSKVNYVNCSTKVEIICSQHGLFLQRPSDHLKGKGCRKCADERLGRVSDMNTAKFIQRSKCIHGERYDYSKVNYVDCSTKVEIICPQHGLFLQRPSDHLKGKGCLKCGVEKLRKNNSLSREVFIQRARRIHGQKYDYSKVVYKNGRTDVEIICPIHGAFFQKPEVHLLQRAGCRKCADEKNGKALRLSTKDFIAKARKIHGDKYDYSQVNYTKSSEEIKIICPIHGEFFQKPDVHIFQKGGCPKCAIEKNGLKKRKGTEQFVKEAKAFHGDKYDYSQVVYVNSITPINIICPIHGVFSQLPSVHLKGGCPKCIGKNKSTKEYIEEAQKVHGDKYDYSKVKYTMATDKICIICKKHGEFWQRAIEHLSGRGCPKCRSSRLENLVMKKLDANAINYKYQKRFSWLKNKTYMSLDFYLPQQKIAIECQGIQHFGVNTRTSTIFRNVEEIMFRDKLKYNLCKQHGIRIIYFCDDIDNVPLCYFDVIYTDLDQLISMVSGR